MLCINCMQPAQRVVDDFEIAVTRYEHAPGSQCVIANDQIIGNMLAWTTRELRINDPGRDEMDILIEAAAIVENARQKLVAKVEELQAQLKEARQ